MVSSSTRPGFQLVSTLSPRLPSRSPSFRCRSLDTTASPTAAACCPAPAPPCLLGAASTALKSFANPCSGSVEPCASAGADISASRNKWQAVEIVIIQHVPTRWKCRRLCREAPPALFGKRAGAVNTKECKQTVAELCRPATCAVIVRRQTGLQQNLLEKRPVLLHFGQRHRFEQHSAHSPAPRGLEDFQETGAITSKMGRSPTSASLSLVSKSSLSKFLNSRRACVFITAGPIQAVRGGDQWVCARSARHAVRRSGGLLKKATSSDGCACPERRPRPRPQKHANDSINGPPKPAQAQMCALVSCLGRPPTRWPFRLVRPRQPETPLPLSSLVAAAHRRDILGSFVRSYSLVFRFSW
jgi:hypothetical protein